MNNIVNLLIDSGIASDVWYRETHRKYFYSEGYYWTHVLYPFSVDGINKPYKVTFMWTYAFSGKIKKPKIIITDNKNDVSVSGDFDKELCEKVVKIFENKEDLVRNREKNKLEKNQQELLERFTKELTAYMKGK